MGDYVDEHGVGRNLTPGGLARKAEQLDNEPQSGRLSTNDEGKPKNVAERFVDAFYPSKDTYGQKLTEAQLPINLLFTYKLGQPPLILTCKTHKEVFELISSRKVSVAEDFPVYLLKIEDGRVGIERKIYPMEEGDNG